MSDERVDNPEHHLAAVFGLHVHCNPPRLTGGINHPHLQVRSRALVFPLRPIGRARRTPYSNPIVISLQSYAVSTLLTVQRFISSLSSLSPRDHTRSIPGKP